MDQADVTNLWTCFTNDCFTYWNNVSNYGQGSAANLTQVGNNISLFSAALVNVNDTYLGSYIMCEMNCLNSIFTNTWESNFAGTICGGNATLFCTEDPNCYSNYTAFFGAVGSTTLPAQQNFSINASSAVTFTNALSNGNWSSLIGCLIGNAFMNA